METHKVPMQKLFDADPHMSVYQSDFNIFDGRASAISNIVLGQNIMARWVKSHNETKVWLSMLQDSLAKCKFGRAQTVFATFVSETEVRCIIPGNMIRLKGGEEENKEISLTFNGHDYFPTKVFVRYYPNCLPGTYGPDDIHPLRGTRCLECPMGHYCEGVGQYRSERCYPGTYNDKTGQTHCIPCPLGYFCPSYEMTIPTLCTAGYVCDTVGTIMPINPCPQGHYCLAGTATSLGDCCATGPALGHAAVVDPRSRRFN